jgi:hypothetical protein
MASRAGGTRVWIGMFRYYDAVRTACMAIPSSILAKEAGLSIEDTEDAVHELSGFVELSTDHVIVKGALFSELDRYWKLPRSSSP